MGLSSKQVPDDQPPHLSKPPASWRQQPPPEALNCPRCGSTNTKFCYYNNYNKSQPRHFCKSCKRHWTKGGTLRNVPVGGGRKNKRPKIQTPSAATSSATTLPPAAHDISSDDQKGMSSILFQSLICSSSPLLSIPAGSDAPSPPEINPGTEVFQFSNFEMNAAAYMNVPNQQQPLINPYDQCLENSGEESTVTTVNFPNRAGSPLPWPGPDMDFSNSGWNWNDIDVFASSNLNMAWNDDGDGIKFKPFE